ncbi:MAG TPA: hypothetical protein EYP34_01595 [Chromatiaceae bacterium]|nr:hypothetical protein [Chromatiaceae bacterium]
MSEITNNVEFKKALESLECGQQRKLAARFVEDVLFLTKDERIPKIIKAVLADNPSQEELEAARKAAQASIVDSHCRCGSDCDWREQAAYFVARAAAATVAPDNKCLSKSAAWEAAVNTRMACTCASIEGEDITERECEKQQQIANEFLKALQQENN